MKNLAIAVLLLFGVVTAFSCKKTNQSPTPVTVMGRWSLVSDSTYLVYAGYTPNVYFYTGVAADFYNFELNGKLSMHEQNFTTDTADYVLSSANKLAIGYYGKSNKSSAVNSNYTITTLTAHKMVLIDGPYSTTDAPGYAGQVLIFSR
jgi:hypothetical protein